MLACLQRFATRLKAEMNVFCCFGRALGPEVFSYCASTFLMFGPVFSFVGTFAYRGLRACIPATPVLVCSWAVGRAARNWGGKRGPKAVALPR